MSEPTRPTVESQVWPGHAPVPTFETPLILAGRKGIDLVSAVDEIEAEALLRELNLRSRFGGYLEVRPGMTALGTTAAATRIHSLFRLNDPAASAFARFGGGNANLFRGTTGAFTNVDSGYSGAPLSFCGVNMPLSGTPYVFIGDPSRNRKIARTGAIDVIGIPPAALTSTALVAASSKTIALFAAGDGTNAAAWTATAGQDRTVPPNAAGAPVLTDVGGMVQMVTAVGAAATGYDSIMSIARTLDLTTFGGGVDITDDDFIHLLFNVSTPNYLEEVKIYFVTSPVFTAGAIPGASAFNGNAWFKAVRQNDFTAFHERMVSSTVASGTLRANQLLQDFKTDSNVRNPRPAQVNTAGITELDRTIQPEMQPGRNVWFESGIIGIPIRRGDFARVGNDLTTGWNTITGIVIVVQTNAVQSLTVQFSNWFVIGGDNPDTADAEDQAYDYRVINYHPANGSKGNPSAVQAVTAWLNPLRQGVTVTPTASGDAALRQAAYRRGGSPANADQWRFVAQNSADGGAITDHMSDEENLTEEELEIDNDQPVTSVSSAGATVLNQRVTVFFLFENYAFALGDPLQPGRLYRSKLDFPEAWPATDFKDVCAASEILQTGGQIGSAGFVFSRARMYTILLGNDGEWSTEPTSCNEGLVSRFAMAITPYGIAFVSPFGVRLTGGGVPEDLSGPKLKPLFEGKAAGNLNYIDFTDENAMQLGYHDSELWFTYKDSAGDRKQLIFNFFDKTWRPYAFAGQVAAVYSEPVSGEPASLLMGLNSSGAIATHGGFSDLGTAISFGLRTGSAHYGQPRNEKLLAEIVLDAELLTGTVIATPYLNYQTVAGTAVAVTGTAGLKRYILEPFGLVPGRSKNVAVDLSGIASTSGRPYIHRIGVTAQLQPEITYNEATPWEELPGGEGYVWGVLITCDTGGTARTVEVEYTMRTGAVTSIATLTVSADGRKKLPFSFQSTLAHQIRLRPTGDCQPWIRYKVEWLSDPEPVRVTGWDTNWQEWGTLADKWLKGYLIEADTFNAAKTLVIDIDQTLAAQTSVLTFNGRGVQHISFAKLRGRIFRLRTTDANYGKLYKWQPIFDEEPLAITRWESEERPHQGMAGKWQKPIQGLISLRSTGAVTLTITSYGYAGTVMDTSAYVIPTTGGAKQKVRVPFNPAKGLLFVYLFTAAAGFYVYREESDLEVEDWLSGSAVWVPLPSSNDDLDPARTMGNASVAAATPGGA